MLSIFELRIDSYSNPFKFYIPSSEVISSSIISRLFNFGRCPNYPKCFNPVFSNFSFSKFFRFYKSW